MQDLRNVKAKNLGHHHHGGNSSQFPGVAQSVGINSVQCCWSLDYSPRMTTDMPAVPYVPP